VHFSPRWAEWAFRGDRVVAVKEIETAAGNSKAAVGRSGIASTLGVSAALARQWFLRLGMTFAPEVVGDWAFAEFIRPPVLSPEATRTMRRLRERLRDAELFSVDVEGRRVQGYRINGSGCGTVALIHGWGGEAAVMAGFIDPLTKSGFDVVLVDLPAHGQSPGEVLHMPMGVAALAAVYDRTGPWHGIVAHSFGGVVAVSALSGLVNGIRHIRVDKIALIAAPNSVPRLFEDFGRQFRLSARAMDRLKSNGSRLSGTSIDAFVAGDILRRAGIPAQVFHAPDDEEVAFEEAQAIAANCPRATLQIVPGAGHRRILYARETIRGVSNFFAG